MTLNTSEKLAQQAQINPQPTLLQESLKITYE